MKTKKQSIPAILLLVFLVTGIVFGAVPDEDPPKTTTVSGVGWQSHACVIKKVYLSPIEIKIDVKVDATKTVGGDLTINTEISMIDCCTGCSDEYSWCNFDGDHEGC